MNSYIATNQFRIHHRETEIPYIVLLINGLPVVIGEAHPKALKGRHQYPRSEAWRFHAAHQGDLGLEKRKEFAFCRHSRRK